LLSTAVKHERVRYAIEPHFSFRSLPLHDLRAVLGCGPEGALGLFTATITKAVAEELMLGIAEITARNVAKALQPIDRRLDQLDERLARLEAALIERRL